MFEVGNGVRLQITKFSSFGRAHGSCLPHRLTGRQAPLKGCAPLVRFFGVVKTERYMQPHEQLSPPYPTAGTGFGVKRWSY